MSVRECESSEVGEVGQRARRNQVRERKASGDGATGTRARDQPATKWRPKGGREKGVPQCVGTAWADEAYAEVGLAGRSVRPGRSWAAETHLARRDRK